MSIATEISVVIPSYNESDRLPPTLSRIDQYMRGTGLSYELLVVDDGSTDGTADVARKASAGIRPVRVIENGVNRGKGYSVKRGFLESSGEYVLFSDADLSTPIEELGRFMPDALAGADIVIGSRAVKESNILKRQPIYRVLMGKTFNRIVRALTVRGISDTQCGFKLFRRSTTEALFRAQRVDRFAFDVELLFLASKRGLKVVEKPVMWTNSPLSRVHVVKDSARMLIDVVGVRLRYLSGGYGGF